MRWDECYRRTAAREAFDGAVPESASQTVVCPSLASALRFGTVRVDLPPQQGFCAHLQRLLAALTVVSTSLLAPTLLAVALLARGALHKGRRAGRSTTKMEGWVPGARLQLRLKETGGETAELQGEVFSYDTNSDALVLRALQIFLDAHFSTLAEEIRADGKRDLRILRGQNVLSHNVRCDHARPF